MSLLTIPRDDCDVIEALFVAGELYIANKSLSLRRSLLSENESSVWLGESQLCQRDAFFHSSPMSPFLFVCLFATDPV